MPSCTSCPPPRQAASTGVPCSQLSPGHAAHSCCLSPLLQIRERLGVSLGERPPTLVPVTHVMMCMNCGCDFSLTLRRHHCHACGKVRLPGVRVRDGQQRLRARHNCTSPEWPCCTDPLNPGLPSCSPSRGPIKFSGYTWQLLRLCFFAGGVGGVQRGRGGGVPVGTPGSLGWGLLEDVGLVGWWAGRTRTPAVCLVGWGSWSPWACRSCAGTARGTSTP